MGKGNKNTKRNAYYFFMEEYRNTHGHRKLSMAEVSLAASPSWQRMTSKQKQKYENMAKASRDSQQKQTSIGESIDDVLQAEKEKKDREILMRQEVDNIMKRGMNTGTIADQNFYLIHINIFCYWEHSDRYFPAEIALGKFNLRNGIIKEDIYHASVKPGPLPLGYAARVKLNSEDTHQIEHSGDENNMEEVFLGILAKLSEDLEGEEFPPIFVSEKDVLLVENVLGHMCEYYGQNYSRFKLYSLEYMLFSLKNNTSSTSGNVKVWPTISISKLLLEKDTYDFCTGISCNYHEKAEITLHCSLSIIIRWAYICCENCIEDLNIKPELGRHVPLNSLISSKSTGTASGFSVKSKASNAPSVISRGSSSTKYHTDDASETSTIVDESEISSYHGFDSDSQVADDEEEWRRPRRTTKYRTPQHLSQQSQHSQQSYMSQLSQSSSSAEYVPARRPVSQSAVVPGLGRLAISNVAGKGRGRGVLQTRPPM